MHSQQYHYPIHQCNPLEIPKGPTLLEQHSRSQYSVQKVLLALKTFLAWKESCHEKERETRKQCIQKQKALLPNPTTIVHWKKNHLGAKRQLFSHIGRKINWISNSFSRTYYPTTTVFYTSQSTIRDKKGHHTNTPLSPFRRPVFFSYFIADCILY